MVEHRSPKPVARVRFLLSVPKIIFYLQLRIKQKMKILTYPNPILENKSENVNIPLNEADTELIKNMWNSVQKIGVGLAAPQVGVNKNIFIVHMSEDRDMQKGLKESDFVVINPVITFYSELEVEMIEGCLSFPDQYYRIWRPKNIQLKYDTISNFKDFIHKGKSPVYKKQKTIQASGWLSRIIQHEYDHLNGNIFIKKGGIKLSEKDLQKLSGGDIID
jgi:peptide deformylase